MADYAFRAGRKKYRDTVAAIFDAPEIGVHPRVAISLTGKRISRDQVIFTGHAASGYLGSLPNLHELRFGLDPRDPDLAKIIEANCLLIAARIGNRGLLSMSKGQTVTVPQGAMAVDAILEKMGKAEKKSEAASGVIRSEIDILSLSGMKLPDCMQRQSLEGETVTYIKSLPHITVRQMMSGYDIIDKIEDVNRVLLMVGGRVVDLPEIDFNKSRFALRGVAAPKLASIIYYGSDVNVSAEESADREQIAGTYPLLAEIIALDEDLRQAVAERSSVQTVLAEKLPGLTKASLKALSKLNQPLPVDAALAADDRMEVKNAFNVTRQVETRFDGASNLGTALHVLSELPAEWFPKDNDAWKAFSDCLFSMALPISRAIDVPVQDLLKSSKGDWVELRATLARAAGVKPGKDGKTIRPESFDRRDIALKAGAVMDMLRLFSRHMVLGTVVKSAVSRNAWLQEPDRAADLSERAMTKALTVAAEVFIGKSKSPLVALLDAQRVFEGHETHIHDAMIMPVEFVEKDADQDDFEAMYESGTYLAVRKEFIAPNGYHVTPLKSAPLQVELGAYMGMCVGGPHHVSEAMKADKHFWHVWHPDMPKNPYYEGTLMLSGMREGADIAYEQFFTYANGQVLAKKKANWPYVHMDPPENYDFIDKANGVASGSLVSRACWEAWEAWKESWTPVMVSDAAEKREAWRKFYFDKQGMNYHSAGLSSAERNKKTWDMTIGEAMAKPEHFQDTWNAWQPVLVKSDKAMQSESSEVLFRNKGAQEIVKMVSPDAYQKLLEEGEERRRAREVAAADVAGPQI